MGILNLSLHSFSSTGRFPDPERALQHALRMQAEGAAIIDVGAEPTNPQICQKITAEDELARLRPLLSLLARELAIPISVDTSEPLVMEEAVNLGASFINDVRALKLPGALAMAVKLKVPVCLMHMSEVRSLSRHVFSREQRTEACPVPRHGIIIGNIVDQVSRFLSERVAACLEAGMAREAIVIDPGFGGGLFGKGKQENLQLLRQLSKITALGYPVLVGVSRKTFIGEVLDLPEGQRLCGSLAASVIALMHGAKVIRTHDVQATVEALKVTYAVMQEGKQYE
jgi:dihydropteroate synthase